MQSQWRADQAVPNVHLRLIKYVLPSPNIGREWIGILKQRIIRAHEQYVKDLWEQTHGS